MRCKKHLTDGSSNVGVCASCLRERLFSLIAAQEEAPLPFPRSVSNQSPWQLQHNAIRGVPDHRFYTTPQVGPDGTTAATSNDTRKKKNHHHGFSFFSGLFRSHSKRPDSDHTVSHSGDSWFSGILPGRRKKQSRTFSVDESSSIGGNRGISPGRYSTGEDEHCNGGSSGYSSENSRRAPNARRRTGGRPGHHRSLSGMSICWSPLVRASPSKHWNQKGIQPEMTFPGEVRVPAKHRHSDATSLCKNRSRKLVDLGRFNSNR